MSDVVTPDTSDVATPETTTAPSGKQRNAVLRVFDLPLERDWLFWLTAAGVAPAILLALNNPARHSESRLWLYVHVVGLAANGFLYAGFLPGSLRLSYRLRRLRRSGVAPDSERGSERQLRSRLWILALVLVPVLPGVFTGFQVLAGQSISDETRKPAGCPDPGGASPRRTTFPGPPPLCIDPARSYTAHIETDVGTIVVALNAAKAPQTVNSFVFLSRYHYYDGAPFHRAFRGFALEGGDGARGDGFGSPGYTIPDELPSENYKVGWVGMANSGRPNTGGDQFFIVTGVETRFVPPTYSLLGTVVQGMDAVRAIEADGSSEFGGPPRVLHRILRVTITET